MRGLERHTRRSHLGRSGSGSERLWKCLCVQLEFYLWRKCNLCSVSTETWAAGVHLHNNINNNIFYWVALRSTLSNSLWLCASWVSESVNDGFNILFRELCFKSRRKIYLFLDTSPAFIIKSIPTEMILLLKTICFYEGLDTERCILYHWASAQHNASLIWGWACQTGNSFGGAINSCEQKTGSWMNGYWCQEWTCRLYRNIFTISSQSV